ncbi:MAG: ABC-F family ATP-binding cassette domain-containing protein [Saprospiraceae bacterium]|nr:ABC-F family ATP-binding cassette domain-containing protein [Saprospiraceae bacterium]
MQYLLLENINKSFGEKVLFDDINLSITKGDKIALIAKNGSGKTTLLKVIAGTEGIEGENAKIQTAKGIEIAYLEQEPYFHSDASVLDAVLESDHPSIQAIRVYEEALQIGDNAALEEAIVKIEDLKAWDVEHRMREILSKLNITDLKQKVGQLSGGQKKRIALAKIILRNPDFLILDEPTNHLDIDMIEWLENYLESSQLTIFMVTHDRYFLERVCNTIIELDRGNVYPYKGNYSNYLEKKDARMANESVVLDKTQKLFKKELQWIRRQPKARSTKAKSRVDDFQDIKQRAHQKLDDDEMTIHIKSARMGSKILEAHGLSKSFGDKHIIKSFNYKFKKGERVGIVGPNGAGKSTVLKLLTGELKPDGGKVVVGDTIVFGYYTQSGMNLKDDKRVIEVVRDIAEYIPLEKGQKLTAESLLEKFLFPRAQQRVYVSQLSGGERRRLYLLTILMSNPNFLILDEPTNDLDVLTLNVLENFLMDFPGCLIIVSHDRYFTDKLVQHLFILDGEGGVKDYNGNYSKYRADRLIEIREQQRVDREKRKVEEVKVNQVEQAAKQLSHEERKAIKRLEKVIEKLEERKKTITLKFTDAEITPDQIAEMSKEIAEVKSQIVEKEEEWFMLSEG